MEPSQNKFETSPSKSKQRRFSVVPMIFVLMWSSGAIFAKLGLQSTEPLTFLALRLLFSMAIMWLICLLIRPDFPQTISEWRNILITGMFLQAGYQIFFFDALAHQVSPGLLTIILGIQPILTAIVGKERITGAQWAGLLFGMMGLILVVVDSLFIVKISLIGITSAVLSMLSITPGNVLAKTYDHQSTRQYGYPVHRQCHYPYNPGAEYGTFYGALDRILCPCTDMDGSHRIGGSHNAPIFDDSPRGAYQCDQRVLWGASGYRPPGLCDFWTNAAWRHHSRHGLDHYWPDQY